jgi:hypothetical protein
MFDYIYEWWYGKKESVECPLECEKVCCKPVKKSVKFFVPLKFPPIMEEESA